jgi:hypothetical protein
MEPHELVAQSLILSAVEMRMQLPHGTLKKMKTANDKESFSEILKKFNEQVESIGFCLLWIMCENRNLPCGACVLKGEMCGFHPPSEKYPHGYWSVQNPANVGKTEPVILDADHVIRFLSPLREPN